MQSGTNFLGKCTNHQQQFSVNTSHGKRGWSSFSIRYATSFLFAWEGLESLKVLFTPNTKYNWLEKSRLMRPLLTSSKPTVNNYLGNIGNYKLIIDASLNMRTKLPSSIKK